MAEAQAPTDIEKLSFEDALKELEQIVQALEGGRGKLDEAIRSYERGSALKRHCEKKLSEAQAWIEKIAFGADGTVKSEPANFS
jgi:exodeoxyribonuclease VII small subunit